MYPAPAENSSEPPFSADLTGTRGNDGERRIQVSMFNDLFIAPFSEFEFMRRALAGALALALGAGPIGEIGRASCRERV